MVPSSTRNWIPINAVHQPQQKPENKKMRTLPLRNSIPSFLIPLALAVFALSPTVRAISPLPDGGYTLNNTAEGTNALFTFTGVFPNNGGENTAIGFEALYHNTGGNHNTACGLHALLTTTTGGATRAAGHNALGSNTTGTENTATGRHAFNLNPNGSYTAADGEYARGSRTTASQNTALGYAAGYNL